MQGLEVLFYARICTYITDNVMSCNVGDLLEKVVYIHIHIAITQKNSENNRLFN